MPPDDPGDQYRLPHTVVPSRYDLTLEPDLEAGLFAGSVSVDVNVAEPVHEVVLNALDLEIDEAWLEGDGGVRIDAEPRLDVETERLRLALAEQAQPGAWTLHLKFRGILNDKLVGFYRSKFKDSSGREHLIATTQMESTHARQAFPCWDEPDFKATFAVTLVVPQGLAALSNGEELASEPVGDGRRRVTYAETMRMSSYLVAFVVGPLGITEPVGVDGTPLRVAYPPERGNLTSYGLETGAFALRYFADYFGLGYPAGKLDLVAIPDFASGAMENLGCITFRETALLVDPARAPQPDLQRVADVVHHEIAHMWFGDLVTMKWWNGIWLNEAFATFMEMKCTDAFRPQWKRWVDFGLSRTAAFDVDSLTNTRPVEFKVVSPAEAEGMFDILTYEKGAAVLRMLEQHLGEQPFREGVRLYLSNHAYGNTETTDLWDDIERATGHPVRRIMDSWIFQGGYPILSARVSVSDGRPTIHLTQERFRYWGAPGGEGLGEQWVVPVAIRYGASNHLEEEKLLLDGLEARVPLAFAPEWILVNSGANGFYRVRYSPDLLAKLVRAGQQALNPSERYQLVDDSYAAVLAGNLTAAEFLGLVRGWLDEADLSVWQRIAGALGALDRIVDDDARPRYQAAVRSLIAPALGRLGNEPSADEDERSRQLRATLFEVLGTVGTDPEILDRARALHDAYLADPDGVDPGLAAAAISVVAESGGPEEFQTFWKRHLEASSPQLAVRYLHALARFHDPKLTARLLELTLSEVKTQDAPYLLGGALANRTAGSQVWDFIVHNWETLLERFPSNSIVRMVGGVRTFTDPGLADEVEAFFARHPVPQGGKTLDQHLERMRVNVALKQRESARLAAAV
jgi:puromycin-sensitive aminopeptidase